MMKIRIYLHVILVKMDKFALLCKWWILCKNSHYLRCKIFRNLSLNNKNICIPLLVEQEHQHGVLAGVSESHERRLAAPEPLGAHAVYECFAHRHHHSAAVCRLHKQRKLNCNINYSRYISKVSVLSRPIDSALRPQGNGMVVIFIN